MEYYTFYYMGLTNHDYIADRFNNMLSNKALHIEVNQPEIL